MHSFKALREHNMGTKSLHPKHFKNCIPVLTPVQLLMVFFSQTAASLLHFLRPHPSPMFPKLP